MHVHTKVLQAYPTLLLPPKLYSSQKCTEAYDSMPLKIFNKSHNLCLTFLLHKYKFIPGL